MLVEHDFGRYHIGELEKALKQYADAPAVEAKLDIVAHAASFADLLQRHIGKEDTVCYTYALRALPKKCIKQIDEQTREFEKNAECFYSTVNSVHSIWLYCMTSSAFFIPSFS